MSQRRYIETLFEIDSVQKAFGDDANQYKPRPAKGITAALVAGLYSPEFMSKVIHILDMRGGWNDNSDEVIVVVRDAALERRTIELADKLRCRSRGTHE